ncbi:MAG: MFS transporter [Xanthobacteraceae bacterium]
MNRRILLFMIQAVTLQIIAVVLRVATSYQGIELGMSTLTIGLVSSSFALFPIFFSVFVGRLLDRHGEPPALLGGSVFLVVSAALFLLFRGSALGLTAATMALGLGHFLTMVGQHSYVASHSDPARRDAQFGWYAAAISLGQAIGPVLIALPAQGTRPDMGPVFLIGGGVATFHFLITLPVVRGLTAPVPVVAGDRSKIGSLVRIPGLPTAILSGIAVMAALDLLAIYLPVLGTERQIEAAVVASLLSLRALATLAARLAYGSMIRHLSRNAFLALTIGGSAIGVALLTIPAPLPFLVVAILITGFGLGAALPITLSIIIDIAPRADRGTVLSLRQSALRLSQVFIPVAGGGLALFAGVSGVFLLLAVFLGGAALVAAKSIPRPA